MILSKKDIKKTLDEKNQYIIDGIDCSLHLHVFNKNSVGLVHTVYTDKLSTDYKTVITYDIVAQAQLKTYLQSLNIIEIFDKKSSKKGKYEIDKTNTTYTLIKFLDGDDVLEYKKELFSHDDYLYNNLKLYNKINYDKQDLVSITHENSSRDTIFFQKYTAIEHKAWTFKDETFFNYLIKKYKNKEIVLLREISGNCKYDIYTNCKIFKYSIENRVILFKILKRSKHIYIHNDLNIDPIKEYKTSKRKIKIKNIINK